MFDLIIKNGITVLPSGIMEADILINDEKVIGVSIPRSDFNTAKRVINARAKYVLPGAVDPHTHFENPSRDIITAHDFRIGTMAAAFGGTTTIIDFAIQKHGESLLKSIEERRRTADGKVVVDYSLHSGITDLSSEVLAEIPKIINYGIPAFKVFMTYRKERWQIEDGEFFEILKQVAKNEGLVCVHAENGDIIEHNIERLLKKGKTSPFYHAVSRPNFVEEEAINRAIIFSRENKAALYIVHLSTEEGKKAIFKAREDGYPIYTETCPHYLIFTEEKLRKSDGMYYIMSPPLRKQKDTTALWKGLEEKTISVISSDDAAYLPRYKIRGRDNFTEIANGVPGVETRLPLVFSEGVNKGRISLERMVELLCANPAKIFGLYPKKGVIAPGSDADIVILDPKKKLFLNNLHTCIDEYPIYKNIEITGIPEVVILRGKVIMEENTFLGDAGQGKFVKRKINPEVLRNPIC